jgi:hypothetical protein
LSRSSAKERFGGEDVAQFTEAFQTWAEAVSVAIEHGRAQLKHTRDIVLQKKSVSRVLEAKEHELGWNWE